MELNKDHINENKQRNSFRDCYSKGVRHHHLCFGRDSEASRGAGSFIEDKGKASVLPGLEAGGMGRSTQENY